MVYLAEKGNDFKVLLLMDNAGGHAVDIEHDGVQVEFLRPNTSLIQLMDQGVIRAFKALYTRNYLQSLVEVYCVPTLRKFTSRGWAWNTRDK